MSVYIFQTPNKSAYVNIYKGNPFEIVETSVLIFSLVFWWQTDNFILVFYLKQLLFNHLCYFFYRSNCHADILEEMHKYYSKPHFLPPEAEHSHVDYIFMGYQQGAFMHVSFLCCIVYKVAYDFFSSNISNNSLFWCWSLKI